MGEGIFYQRMFLAVSLAFLFVAFVIIILFAFAPPPILYPRSRYLLEPSLRKLGEVHVERAEDDLVDDRPETDNRVINFVAKLC